MGSDRPVSRRDWTPVAPSWERRRECAEADAPNPVNPVSALGRYEYHWTVSDHVHFLVQAGFQVKAVEEVGEVRQTWEIPNLRGLPEQLIIAADKPGRGT